MSGKKFYLLKSLKFAIIQKCVEITNTSEVRVSIYGFVKAEKLV